jgi:uncharacterized membrane protein
MRYRQAIALLALVGLFVALYLWLHQIGIGGELKCGTGACDVVQASRWAHFLGVPVAFYGVAGYAAILSVALYSLRPAALTRRGPRLVLAALATGGFLFTLWLKYLELFVIHAICRWCVASAVIMTAIWIVALLALRTPAPRTDPSGGRQPRDLPAS